MFWIEWCIICPINNRLRSIELFAAEFDINLAKTLKPFVFLIVYFLLQLCFNFGLFRSDSSCTKQITTMNNDVIENVFNSTISFKSLKCHLLLHPGHTTNIRHKSLLPNSPLCVTNLVKLLDCSLNSNETHFCVSGYREIHLLQVLRRSRIIT